MRENIIISLREEFPDKIVLALPENDPKEVIVEVIPSTDNPEESVAIAIIDQSDRHHHLKSVETYEVQDGVLRLYVEDDDVGITRVNVLSPGDVYVVNPPDLHWAQGDSTRVKVTSHPGWTYPDHILDPLPDNS